MSVKDKERICRRCHHLGAKLGIPWCKNPRQNDVGGACLTSPKRFEPWGQYQSECVHWDKYVNGLGDS